MLRLAYGDVVNHNSIAFDRSTPGAFDQVVADFDFRITPGTGRADGLGFALLNTANYGNSGAQAPPNAAEEPNFLGSLGVGFDVYPHPGEPSDNHVSIHYNGALVRALDARPALDLAIGQWIHARIIMRPGGGYSDVSVILSQCGLAPVTLVDQLKVPGLTPYEGRAYIAARSGGYAADHDVDNVSVKFLGLSQGVFAFSTGCSSAIEYAGAVELTIGRTGSLSDAATVKYATAAASAAGSDFQPASGTLTFAPGEATKTIAVRPADDDLEEDDESFAVVLSDAAGAALGGPAAMKVTIVDDEAGRKRGHWGDVLPSPVVPIHMHLLPNGTVMFWDRHDDAKGWDGHPRIWDPATGQTMMASLVPYDIFCSGHAFLEDGSLFVAGGHIMDNIGDDEASIYDALTDRWKRLPQMNAGRWYPSAVTLPSGDVLVMAGTDEQAQLNTVSQVWETSAGRWRDLTNAKLRDFPDDAIFYPFLYAAPNGKVFVAGPQQVARYLDTSGAGAWTDVATSTLDYRDYGSSVMYDVGKVMIVGGTPLEPNIDHPTVPPSASAEVIDLNAAKPAWRTVAPMSAGRRHLNATLLPDGQVLVTGGTNLPGRDDSNGAVLPAEMWNPATEKWTVLAAEKRYRGYHSNALLLPDGRVLIGGGGHPDPAAGPQLNFEIYSPPYLFDGARPVATAAPGQAGYGQPFVLPTPDAADVAAVTLVRLGSVTHAFNQSQRISRLQFKRLSGALSVTTPATPNLAPPGPYMLFIVNRKGVPSLARMVLLTDDVTAPPAYLRTLLPLTRD
jgi:hypothetical protein